MSIAGVDGENNVKMQILRSLREFYPIKVDEIVLISSVQKALKDVTIDRVSQEIKELKSKGLIEESVIKAPFGKTETYRYKITSDGIDYLQSLRSGGRSARACPPARSRPVSSRRTTASNRTWKR